MVFASSVDIGPFWEYLNGLSCLDFTLELPTDEGLPFLGTSVQLRGGLSIGVFRRSGILFTPSRSFIPRRYKFAGVRALLHRAKNICSSLSAFESEVCSIKEAAKRAGLSTTKH